MPVSNKPPRWLGEVKAGLNNVEARLLCAVGEPGAEGTMGTDGGTNDSEDILLALSGPLAVDKVGEEQTGNEAEEEEA